MSSDGNAPSEKQKSSWAHDILSEEAPSEDQKQQEGKEQENKDDDEVTAAETTFDDEYEYEEEEEETRVGRRKSRGNSILGKKREKRGPGKSHPWMDDPNDILDIDIDDSMSVGMVSLGDVSYASKKHGGNPGPSKFAKSARGRRRESRGSLRFAPSQRPSPRDQGDDSSADQPMAPKRHRQKGDMTAINESSIPDLPDDPPLRPPGRFESNTNFEDIQLGGSEQQAGEPALEKVGDPMEHIPFRKAMDRNTTVVVQTQHLHYTPPPGMEVKDVKPKSLWATICPCCPC